MLWGPHSHQATFTCPYKVAANTCVSLSVAFPWLREHPRQGKQDRLLETIPSISASLPSVDITLRPSFTLHRIPELPKRIELQLPTVATVLITPFLPLLLHSPFPYRCFLESSARLAIAFKSCSEGLWTDGHQTVSSVSSPSQPVDHWSPVG